MTSDAQGVPSSLRLAKVPEVVAWTRVRASSEGLRRVPFRASGGTSGATTSLGRSWLPVTDRIVVSSVWLDKRALFPPNRCFQS